MSASAKRLWLIVAAVVVAGVTATAVHHLYGEIAHRGILLRGWTPFEARTCTTYGLVRVATTETALRHRFGTPLWTAHTSDSVWERHVLAWKRAGWTVPPKTLRGKVLVYEPTQRGEKLRVYYFVDRSGHVTAVFVGQT